MDAKKLNLLAWATSLTVIALAVITWGGYFNWDATNLSAYQVFPLFGLIAFSTMWSHYVMSALRQYWGIERAALRNYLRLTSWIVLIAILLHPSILIARLFFDAGGLPPFSYYRYVGDYGKWAVTLGTLSFLAFLSYELYRWFARRSWWRYIQYASDLAMVAIFYHSLTLGTHLQSGWYRYVWFFYGVTYLIALLYARSRA